MLLIDGLPMKPLRGTLTIAIWANCSFEQGSDLKAPYLPEDPHRRLTNERLQSNLCDRSFLPTLQESLVRVGRDLTSQ